MEADHRDKLEEQMEEKEAEGVKREEEKRGEENVEGVKRGLEKQEQQGEGCKQEVVKEKIEEKELILMRGLPGSGKSYKAKQLAGEKGVIYSTDDFFMVNGHYIFDPRKIGDNHDCNFKRTLKAMQDGKPLIIVDNTNIKLWEMKDYVVEGEKEGYKIRIEEADTPWALNPRQCSKRNSHGVPEEAIRRMRDNYETFKSMEQIKSVKSFKSRK